MTEVLVSTEGAIGRIRLNRAKALHALTTDMCLQMLDALAAFEGDDEVAVVVIDHAEGRGFCAGGDIRMLSDSMKGDGVAARAFFHTEYRLDHRLFTYPKPTISIMDGITMGGGVGIALPCRYRIATENTRFAMPETGIGLFPDVGGSWYLSRLPGQVGKFMGLTGARLDGAECLALGLATHYIASADVLAAIAALHDSPDIFATLKCHSTGAPLARIVENRTHIDRLFAGDSVAEIMAALEADGSDWALKELATLRSKSPLSMAVALRQLRDGAAMTDFTDIMRMEYRIAVRVLAHPDFVEGVRAVVIDKDNAPNWQPHVTDADIDAVFAPLLAEEEWTPLKSSPARGGGTQSVTEGALDVQCIGCGEPPPPLRGPPPRAGEELGKVMTFETILVETRDAVTLVTLNRPQALNALNSQILAELTEAFQAYDADPSQRCLVLTGSEKAFSAGADIKEMSDQSFASMYAGNFFAGWERITATRKPWIAAVNGFALGGGCEVAMMADFIIAGDNAKFGQPEIKLGVTPGMGGSQRLTRAIGKAKAMEMCLTGRMMGAEEAERSGLVARVVPAADLVDEALKTATAIAAMPPLAAIATKEMVNAAFETTLAQGIIFERRLFHGLFGTEDQSEGMSAFVEKRAGVWTGK